MKVYVVQIDNGQEFIDYEDYIEGVFKSFRTASKYLIDKGFIPYIIQNHKREWILLFENPKVFGADQAGWITEFELQQ